MTYMLDLSALPDRGASILDLDDGDGPAALAAISIPERGQVLLDCNRPSVQAHLLRWLAWRITGVARACLLSRVGSLWCLTCYGRTLATWVNGHGDGEKDCPELDDIEDVGEAIAALVRAHA